VQWGHGHWNIQGELQRFQLAYKFNTPPLPNTWGYAEARRVIESRLYLAARAATSAPSAVPGYEHMRWPRVYRPNRYQLMKFGYQVQQGAVYTLSSSSTFYRTAGYGVPRHLDRAGLSSRALQNFPPLWRCRSVGNSLGGAALSTLARPLTLGVLSEVFKWISQLIRSPEAATLVRRYKEHGTHTTTKLIRTIPSI